MKRIPVMNYEELPELIQTNVVFSVYLGPEINTFEDSNSQEIEEWLTRDGKTDIPLLIDHGLLFTASK